MSGAITLGKRLVLVAALVTVAGASDAAPSVTIKHPVTDTAGALDGAGEARVTDALVALRDETGVQMAVALIPSTDGVPIDDVAQTVFETWGGGSAERDDGVLFLLAVEDRRMRLHLGYGMETVISDGGAKRILGATKPALRAGDYAAASLSVIAAVASASAHIEPGQPIGRPLGAHIPWTFAGTWLWGALCGLLAGFFVLTLPLPGLARRKRKRVWKTISALEKSRRSGAAAIAVIALTILVIVGPAVAMNMGDTAFISPSAALLLTMTFVVVVIFATVLHVTGNLKNVAVWRVAGTFVGSLAFCVAAAALVFRSGTGFWWVYGVFAAFAFVVVLLIQAAAARGRVAFGVVFVVFSIANVVGFVILNNLVVRGVGIYSGHDLTSALLAFAGADGGAMLFALAAFAGTSGGGGGSSAYPRSSSYSSSSSSSSSSGSSSSSTDWSGGGGSSGGGGANDSW